MATGMKGVSYPERLKALNLSTLSERRERRDAIQLFKIANGQNKVDWSKPTQFKRLQLGKVVQHVVYYEVKKIESSKKQNASFLHQQTE